MLVASCLEVLLKKLPGSLLQDPQLASLLSRADTRIFMTRASLALIPIESALNESKNGRGRVRK